MPKLKTSEPDPAQSARFIEAARNAGCEENFAQFEEALSRIVRAPARPQKPPKPRMERRGRAEELE